METYLGVVFVAEDIPTEKIPVLPASLVSILS